MLIGVNVHYHENVSGNVKTYAQAASFSCIFGAKNINY